MVERSLRGEKRREKTKGRKREGGMGEYKRKKEVTIREINWGLAGINDRRQKRPGKRSARNKHGIRHFGRVNCCIALIGGY